MTRPDTHGALRGPILVTAILLAIIAVYWPTIRDLLNYGAGSDNYTHRILVIPIFFGAVWMARRELASLPVQVSWLGLAGMLAAGALWLAGEIAFIRLFTNVAVILLVPVTVLCLLGRRWLWALAFPLAFLVFAVPIRGPLVHVQVDMTAQFSYYALLASGVPVHREGPYFELPTGKWAVAEACSGVEYLSACLMMTALYAWTMYSKPRKRALFILGGAVVGIVGNWLRAYLTMYIAHLTDNRLLRDSHGTFGWYFFAFLLFVYCAIGWYYRDPVDPPAPSTAPRDPGSPRRTVLLAVGLAAAALLAPTLIRNVVMQRGGKTTRELPGLGAPAGWTEALTGPLEWKPILVNPRAVRTQAFDRDGRRVHVITALFDREDWTSKLVTSVNGVVDPDNSAWSQVERTRVEAPLPQGKATVNGALLIGRGEHVMARQWYWVDGQSTGSDRHAKQLQVQARLAGRDPAGVWIAIFTRVTASPEDASRVLDDFMRASGPGYAAAWAPLAAR